MPEREVAAKRLSAQQNADTVVLKVYIGVSH